MSKPSKEYTELYHIQGKPAQAVELYRKLDRFCLELSPGQIAKQYTGRYVSWLVDGWVFCCAHLNRHGLRVSLSIPPEHFRPWLPFAKDVSKVRHWGIGYVELSINNADHLDVAKSHIQTAYEAAFLYSSIVSIEFAKSNDISFSIENPATGRSTPMQVRIRPEKTPDGTGMDFYEKRKQLVQIIKEGADADPHITQVTETDEQLIIETTSEENSTLIIRLDEIH